MIFFNEYLQGIADVSQVGFSTTSPQYIPEYYLNEGTFIIFRTCHSYGDWVILSAMPRLLKQKYPDCTVIIPSPECIAKFFSPGTWMNKHENPFNNVIEVFANNPYVDGMIDDIPAGYPIYHDHFRIYDESNPHIPLIKQMLKFWRFEDHEIEDCQPDLYWENEEKDIGDKIIENIFEDNEFGFLYIDNSSLPPSCNSPELIREKEKLIQKEISNHNLSWLYYSGDDTFTYKTNNKVINVKNLNISLRIQNYIKSKSKLIIGHQGGYGTDCMSRYTQCYVVPLHPNKLNEHIQIGTNYLL